MKFKMASLAGVVIIEPEAIEDSRGHFAEIFRRSEFVEATGCREDFVQENMSHSVKGVLRGIHYQLGPPQGKLCRVTSGRVLDVCVDLRKSSPSFGRWCALELSAENRRQLWIPPGFGHGFAVRSESADYLYRTTQYWAPNLERTIVWNDPQLAIDWKLDGIAPIVSKRDEAAPLLSDAELFD